DRGDEDNLTVVVVRVGEHLKAGERLSDLEPTISPETHPVYAAQSGNGVQPESNFIPASRIAFPGPPASPAASVADELRLNVADPKAKQGGGGAARVFGFLVVLLLIAGAFYAGARYKERIPF